MNSVSIITRKAQTGSNRKEFKSWRRRDRNNPGKVRSFPNCQKIKPSDSKPHLDQKSTRRGKQKEKKKRFRKIESVWYLLISIPQNQAKNLYINIKFDNMKL